MKTPNWFIGFFKNYFWAGVFFLLISIILDLKIETQTLPIKATITFFEVFGVSIMIASIFTFASSTSQFTEKITSLLRDIVIDRNFLGNIDGESKRDALRALIKPSKAELQSYSEIGRYYDTYISHTMNITHKSVRSDYYVNAVIYKDTEDQKVKAKSYISYRLHPTIDGYVDMKIMFEKEHDDTAIKWIKVTSPDGLRLYDDIPTFTEEVYSGKDMMAFYIPLKDLAKGKTHLKIEFEVIETGFDHWMHLTFNALEPTDGFRYNIECRDGLKIKDYSTFIYGSKFYVDKLNDEKHILLSCDEWVNEGTGLAAVISDETT